jgi:hypothetical protein
MKVYRIRCNDGWYSGRIDSWSSLERLGRLFTRKELRGLVFRHAKGQSYIDFNQIETVEYDLVPTNRAVDCRKFLTEKDTLNLLKY